METNDEIVALATPPGMGAIAVIRISGPKAIALASTVFMPLKGGGIEDHPSHTVHLGHIMDGEEVLDKVLATIFKAPNSYTGENVVEISCHGSLYVQQRIIELLISRGCRMARAGEFTLRAFINGKMDLSQAEAVADLIASENRASHTLAINQMRGGFSGEISKLREQLLHFASMIELELDFAGEDVEFADRTELGNLLALIAGVLDRLIESFTLGNALKNGIPIAIVGAPNAGKSTLLNAILNEDRAIVSEIPGTTRDAIEDEITVKGIRLRFIDTAGLRKTEDVVENIGIHKAYGKLESAAVVLYLIDGPAFVKDRVHAAEVNSILKDIQTKQPDKKIMVSINKTDALDNAQLKLVQTALPGAQLISAKNQDGIAALLETLVADFTVKGSAAGQTIVANARHFNALAKARSEIDAVMGGLKKGLPSDLLAVDIRQALFHLGEITGEITTDDLLGKIFSSFCIGK